MASIFRHYGYIGKCADGYMVNDEGKTIRHGWLEVLIDGKPYYVGSHAEIMPLEDAVKQYTLTRPKGKDGERFFWDEKGQKPYVDNWWEYYLEVEINQRLAFPGGEAIVSVFGPTDVTVDIQLTLEDPNKVKTEYAGVTDPATGEARFTLQLALDTPLGVYHVTAYNPATDFSEIGLFCVDALEISASPVSTKVKPGEMLQMNVRLNKPLVADIWVDSDAVWTTDAEGYVYIVRTITADTPLGSYTLTLSAPDYGISKTINYAVWLPATLKVNITPEENAPGAEFYVNVLIEPAQVTRITMRGYSGGEWMTDKDGRLSILMHVLPTTTPGVYEITMEAPDLGLVASDTYIATLTPRLSGDINVCYTALYIKVNGIDDGDEFEARLGVGGQPLRCTMENFQIHASGRVPAGSIGADMRYDFTLSQDMSRITGSVSLSADNGAKFSFTFSNLTRDTDYEAEVRASSGIEAMAFRVRGTAVDNYLSSFSINDSAIGTVTDYFAGDDSDLIVVLYAATESQIAELIDE
jgi:hypothetical protein